MQKIRDRKFAIITGLKPAYAICRLRISYDGYRLCVDVVANIIKEVKEGVKALPEEYQSCSASCQKSVAQEAIPVEGITSETASSKRPARNDTRLLHGQVATAWPRFKADRSSQAFLDFR